MAAPYVTRAAFDLKRPETLVVCCSDGRFRTPIAEFLSSRVAELPDIYAVPGGPATIDAWASSFDHARVFEGSLELLVASHDLRSAWLITHEGCAFYRHRHGALADEAIRERQFADLRRARTLLHERHPMLAVHLIYARIADGKVNFSEVEEEAGELRVR